MAEIAGPILEAAVHYIFPFLLGVVIALVRIGGVIQRIQTVGEKQQESDKRNSAAHEKLFTGLERLRTDVNGSVGELGKGLVRVDTRVETLPCQPRGLRPADDCPPRGG